MDGLKTCTRCGKELPLSEFSLRHSVKKGLVPRSHCKSCASGDSISAQKAKRENDPESYNLRLQQSRRQQIFKRYGITAEDVQEMLKQQGYSCAMCGTDIAEKPHVDHDHATGKVRKLLCFHCNVGLGHFKDSVALLEIAIDYLRENS